MKKTFIFSLLAAAALGVSAQQYKLLQSEGERPQVLTPAALQAPTAFDGSNLVTSNAIPDDEALVYAFMPYDFERFTYTHSFIKFSTNFPHEWSFSKIADFDTRKGTAYPEITAAAMVGDEYWAYFKAPYDLLFWESMGLYKLNLENGEYRLVDNCDWLRDKNVLYPMDMSYDPVTELLWYVAPLTSNPIQFYGFGQEGTNGWALCCIDPKDPAPYPLQFGPDLPKCVACVAADHGKLYGLAVDYNSTHTATVTSLVEIVPNLAAKSYTFNTVRTYTSSEIDLSAPLDWSSMEWDRTNHRLYASYTDLRDGQVYFSEFDPSNGDILSCELQGGQIIVNAMAMPYQICPDDAPFYPGNLTIATASDGIAETELTWDLPTQTYMKQPLSSITGVRVYRNDELIADLPANATSYFESNVPYGLHEYKVRAYNAAGEGLYASRTAFVGKDTPGMPMNVTFLAEGAEAKLAWAQPSAGAHGAWFDTNSITYKITRHPDEVVVAEGLTVRNFTDVVPTVQGYSYTITASNNEGEGLSTTTQIISFGPNAAIPFFSDLTKETEFQKWLVYDENHDGFTWAYSDGLGATIYDATFCGNTPNDLLFSPVLDTKEGEQYKLTYQVKVHNYRDTEEKFEWYAGPYDADPSYKGDKFEGGSYDSYNSLRWFTRQGVFEGHEGGSRISFVVRSNPLQGILYLGNLSVRLYSDLDLAVTNITGSEMVGENRETAMQVTLKNEGKSTVSKYKIKIKDIESGDETIQEFSEPIASEEEHICRVTWKSSVLGQHKLTAEVILEGDTYTADNTIDMYHQILVAEAGDQEWISVGQHKINDSNWCGINFPYSQSQALYLAEELNLQPGTKIVGIGFAYEGDDDLADMTMINFEVSMGNTNIPSLYDFASYANDWSYYPHLLASSNFPETPFYGFADMSAPSKQVGHLTFDFDDPFIYDGRNLLIKVVRTTSTKVAERYVQFHYDILDPTDTGEINPDARAIYVEAQDEVTEGAQAKGHGHNQLPILYLGYDVTDGIQGVKTIGSKLTADAQNGKLVLSQACANVTLSDLNGVVLYSGSNVKQIDVRNVNATMGVLTATLKDGSTTTLKVRIK
ncbi:MAG: hypothetical protein KBT20_10390 [Bacteroidales bacterium]|nr:hypothetical protein [Candidatus Liminaster caballi]